MNEKKKDFMFFPEWGWMIITGLLLAILVLMDVVPGHAEEVTPIPTPAVEDPRYNYATYIFAQNNSVFILGSDHSFIELPSPHDYQVNNNTEALERLRLDYVRSLDTFFDFIPAAETTIYYADENASIGTLNFLISVLDPFDCYFMYEYSESAYVPDYSDSTQYTFISAPCGPYNIGVYKKNTLIVPSATPTPSPSPELAFSFLSYGDGYWDRDSQFSSTGYYLFDIYAAGFGSIVPVELSGNDALALAMNNYSVESPWISNSFVESYNSSAYCGYLYFSGTVSKVVFRYLGTSLATHDKDILRESYSAIEWVKPSSSALSFNAVSSNGLSCVALYFEHGQISNYIFDFSTQFNSLSFSSLPFSGIQDSDLFRYNSTSVNSPLVQGYRIGLTGSSVVDPVGPSPTPTLGPTSTPVPLPTSGESIHVILPSGTPTPTPPFSVPGGSDSGTGSGSPGSIGSGLSSQQTSGILEYWSSFVSDNPAMLFLTSTFQSLPQELLYPLYILLFILLLLAVIRLFVHFSGG